VRALIFNSEPTSLQREEKSERPMSFSASWKYYTACGATGVVPTILARLVSPRREIEVRSKQICHPIHLRLRSSDPLLFREIIREHSYDLQLPTKPRVIIDAGANIGLTSVWFANQYPEARIIAIEPEPDNVRMLRKNTERYPNISVIPAALWNRATTLTMDYSANSTAGWKVMEAAGNVRTVSIPEVMEMFQLRHVDLLKVDIEGAEKEVFESSSGWINSVDTIAIELHDRFKAGCAEAVFGATPNFLRQRDRGELAILEARP
jgi:FkbM family methyltransferase